MKKKIVLILLIFACCFFAFNVRVTADSEYETLYNSSSGNVAYYFGSSVPIKIKKTYSERTTEFRGTWVSFYAGDISSYTSEANMKSQLLGVLNTLEYYNMNAVVFHIRTHNDALYNTTLAPQSSYTRLCDYETWDYLEWFINECHKRGIEFHAWLNPYRIYSSGGTLDGIEEKYKDYPNNPAHDINNVLINGDGAAILDPGLPEVRSYIVDTCIEIMEKYDVDAIHFDDYFYINDIDDSETRRRYNTSNLSLENFRRAQVDLFIKELSDAMYEFNIENNRAVQLGISPTAVYKNYGGYVSPDDYRYDANGTLTYPNGSSTSAWSHYGSSLFCDTKKWVDNEWIDYIVPQAYFALDYAIASFAACCDWWSGVCRNKKTNLYMGMGLYKTPEGPSAYGWYYNSDEILKELRYAGDNGDINGVCIYQYKYLNSYKEREVMKSLTSSYWTSTPKSPETLRYKSNFDTTLKVNNLKIHEGENTIALTWDKIDGVDRYAVYRYEDSLNLASPSQVVGYAGEVENGKCGILDSKAKANSVYAVIPITRANSFCVKEEIENGTYSAIDLKLGEVEASPSSSLTSVGQASFIIDSISASLGGDVYYTVIGSLNEDFSDSFVISNEEKYLSRRVVRYNFNKKGKPTYIKIICKTSLGTFESKVYMQYITDTAVTISSYVKSEIDSFFKDALGD